MKRPFITICLLLFLTSCAVLLLKNYDVLYGTPSAKENRPTQDTVGVEFHKDVRPILESRCVVCHACYDAPCQLKLESYDGLLRGSSTELVYNGKRLRSATPTRLYIDAQSTSEWRDMGFHPVLNERINSPTANLDAGLMAQMLELKVRNPSPDTVVLPDTFDFSLKREQQCPTIESFEDFASNNPLWGMPFGLPELPQQEYRALRDWLALGAPTKADQPLSKKTIDSVDYWETLFNGTTLKHQLVGRYIYEHLYLANLYFEDTGSNTVFFKMVRSSTPPGEPIQKISTLRPYDSPGKDVFYYRLWRDPSSIIAKTHMPYALDENKRAKWSKWFFETKYSVNTLPNYGPTASNPFVTFEQLPLEARHHFLLEEAQFTIMNFIKGPVCHGSMALNVIQDHFWVYFATPDNADALGISHFLASQGENLILPAQSESGLWSITHWRDYAKAQKAYLSAKGDFLRSKYKELGKKNIDLLWDGDQSNPNVALTIFRHFDSASVVKGLVGEEPKTAWIIDYPVLERIHYLLVAGFDVFGTGSHQAMTRLYMDFLRMESEMNFLAFLPDTDREAEAKSWYRDAPEEVEFYLDAYFKEHLVNTPLKFTTDNPKHEVFGIFKEHIKTAERNNYSLSLSSLPADQQTTLNKINSITGIAASLVPQTIFLNVEKYGVFSILSNSEFTNVSSMFDEKDRRLPEKDSLTIVNGIIGAYPNVLFNISLEEIPEFVEMLQEIKTEADYIHILDRFAIRRTNDKFWPISDEIHRLYRDLQPLRAGILDYNRIENR